MLFEWLFFSLANYIKLLWTAAFEFNFIKTYQLLILEKLS